MNDDERRATARMIYDYLSQAPVLLALAVPPGNGPALEVPANENALSQLAVSVDPKTGHTALPLFLDKASLAARFPGCRYVSLSAEKALELFVASRYDAIFYAIEGSWLSNSRAEAAEMLAAGRGLDADFERSYTALMKPGALAPVLAVLLCSCSTKLIRPQSISACGDGGCATVSDAEGRARLLTTLHDLFRSAKGREVALYSADPSTREEKKRGVSFFIQGGPIPGRSTLTGLSVVDVLFIDRDKSELKLVLKNHATYVGVPVICTETSSLISVTPEEAKLASAPFCSWVGIGNGVFRFEFSADFVDAAKGLAGGYWSMKGKGLPLVGGGSGYLVMHFKEEQRPEPKPEPKPAPVVAAAPIPPPAPKPVPKPAPKPAPPAPVVEAVEEVSQAVRLTLTTKLSDESGDLILNGGETMSLKVTAKNDGPSLAAGVEAVLSGEPSLTACLGERKSLGAIPPGESAGAEFSCRLPAQVPSDTVELRVELVAGEAKSLAAAKRLRVGMSPAAVAVEEVVSEIGVDDIPPRAKSGASGNVALVVGLSRYREKAIPAVKYAARDAEVMARYLQNVGGVGSDDIKIMTDDAATKSDLEAYLEDWLPRRVRPDTTVFFYYAGHGAPDAAGKESFLVPYEGHPDFPTKLYPLARVYAALAKLPAKAVVVMLDSCFSGAKGRGLSQEGARPLVSAQMSSGLDPKLAVFAGASGSQITSDLDKVEHGLFTYYLLKGMRGDADKDKDGIVTVAELYPFVRSGVSERASRDLNRDQTPVLLGGTGERAATPVARR